jgi:hypothetical protein
LSVTLLYTTKFYLFWRYWSLNSGPCTWQAGALLLEQSLTKLNSWFCVPCWTASYNPGSSRVSNYLVLTFKYKHYFIAQSRTSCAFGGCFVFVLGIESSASHMLSTHWPTEVHHRHHPRPSCIRWARV